MDAISVSGGHVEGVDITLPASNWTLIHCLPDFRITRANKAALFRLTGTVNAFPFRGFEPGEVLFRGASGSQRGQEDWEIAYRFAASPNAVGLSVGSITGIATRGREHLWMRDSDAVDKNTRVKQPTAAYVKKVYEQGDCS